MEYELPFSVAAAGCAACGALHDQIGDVPFMNMSMNEFEGTLPAKESFSLEKTYGPIGPLTRANMAAQLLERAEQAEHEAENATVNEAMYIAQEQLKKAMVAGEDTDANVAFEGAVRSMLTHGALEQDELKELVIDSRDFVGE